MKTIYLLLKPDGIVDGWGDSRSSENEQEITISEDHPFFLSMPNLYKLVDNELVRLPQEDIDKIINKPQPMSDAERINELENVILMLLMER